MVGGLNIGIGRGKPWGTKRPTPTQGTGVQGTVPSAGLPRGSHNGGSTECIICYIALNILYIQLSSLGCAPPLCRLAVALACAIQRRRHRHHVTATLLPWGWCGHAVAIVVSPWHSPCMLCCRRHRIVLTTTSSSHRSHLVAVGAWGWWCDVLSPSLSRRGIRHVRCIVVVSLIIPLIPVPLVIVIVSPWYWPWASHRCHCCVDAGWW